MASRDQIYDRLLRPDSMRAARAALISRYEWFIHQSELKNFRGIKENGLQLNDRNPDFPYEASQLEICVLGASCRNILCLTPLDL
jgi:hypothetical protein